MVKKFGIICLLSLSLTALSACDKTTTVNQDQRELTESSISLANTDATSADATEQESQQNVHIDNDMFVCYMSVSSSSIELRNYDERKK